MTKRGKIRPVTDRDRIFEKMQELAKRIPEASFIELVGEVLGVTSLTELTVYDEDMFEDERFLVMAQGVLDRLKEEEG